MSPSRVSLLVARGFLGYLLLRVAVDCWKAVGQQDRKRTTIAVSGEHSSPRRCQGVVKADGKRYSESDDLQSEIGLERFPASLASGGRQSECGDVCSYLSEREAELEEEKEARASAELQDAGPQSPRQSEPHLESRGDAGDWHRQCRRGGGGSGSSSRRLAALFLVFVFVAILVCRHFAGCLERIARRRRSRSTRLRPLGRARRIGDRWVRRSFHGLRCLLLRRRSFCHWRWFEVKRLYNYRMDRNGYVDCLASTTPDYQRRYPFKLWEQCWTSDGQLDQSVQAISCAVLPRKSAGLSASLHVHLS